MDKKEISEIRKLMSAEKSVLTAIRGCYVSADKRKISKNKDAFLSLPESESFKYLAICKKALTGKLDKVLYNLEFPVEEEKDGGIQELLYKLRECGLKDDELLDEFYDRVIDQYQFEENYYIILAYGVYDVPGKGSDEVDMEDASDTVFSFIQCCICPVSLSDASLGYQEKNRRIGDRSRDWVVGMPDAGFLFPLFNDRSEDIHGVLYYAKKDEGLENGLISNLLKCAQPLSAKSQKDRFVSMVEDAFGDKCGLRAVLDVQDSLAELEMEQKITTKMIKNVFENCGAEGESLANLDDLDVEIAVSNIAETGCKVKAANVTVQADVDTSLRIEEKMIHGQWCLVIPLEGDVEVNGVPVQCSGFRE